MKTVFPKLTQAIEDGIATGLHIGAQVYVRRAGEVVADFAVGAASLDPAAPLRRDQRMLWLSAGKPLTALAIGILSDRGRVTFDAPVETYVPDFARNGKDGITVRHLLTHTHAYKPPPLDWPRLPREEIIQKICDADPVEGTQPGQYAAYDAQSDWYMLSEIVFRVTGVANHEFVQSELLKPLGCEATSLGMDPDKWTAARDAGELAVMHDTTNSAREKADLNTGAGGSASPWAGDDAKRAAAHNPGGGALGPAGDLAAIYQCLLDGGRTRDGTSLLRESTVKEMTSRQRSGLKDRTFGQVIDWGLGFLINSARYGVAALPYSYGRHASDATFGHGGMQSSSGFADPENQLAVAIIFNGLPGEPKHQKRIGDACTALYEDLGLQRT